MAGSGKRKTSGDTVKEPSSKKTCGRGPVNCNTSNTSTSEVKNLQIIAKEIPAIEKYGILACILYTTANECGTAIWF